MTTTEVVERGAFDAFELDQRRAKAYAESGYWPDAKSIAQALVKIEAGRSLGIPPLIAMSEVHVIQGKPTLGAGALAMLVKRSGKYDYHVLELTPERCLIAVLVKPSGQVIGESLFTLDDAKAANLAGQDTWKKYPRNMLFARALSNAVAWYCPDVTGGRLYTDGELDGVYTAGGYTARGNDPQEFGVTVDEIDWPTDQADLYDAEQLQAEADAAERGETGDEPDDK